MDKIIEDQELLTIGKKTFDVSNVSLYRKKISRRIWDQMVIDCNKELEQCKESEKSEVIRKYTDITNGIIETQGLYLIRQDLMVLKRRMSHLKAVFDYIRRYLLTIKYITKSTEEEYNKFVDWAYFNITGTKKKELETIGIMQKMEMKAVEELQKVYPDPEQLMVVYSTYLQEMVGNIQKSVPIQKT